MNARCVLWLVVLSLVALLIAACATPTPTPAPTPPPPTAAPAQPQPTAAAAATATTAPKVGAAWKVGFISSATGPAAALGVPERDVAKLVSDQLKAAGGVTGPDGVKHDVQILVFDDQSSADTATSLARRLIEQEQVQILVATTASGPSTAIVPIVTEAKVPNVSMASARAIIEDPATKKMREWVFKPVPENTNSADKQAEYLKAVGVTKVCHLYENSAYGQDTLASAKSSFAKAISKSYLTIHSIPKRPNFRNSPRPRRVVVKRSSSAQYPPPRR
jgi:branched-chain amino acid transport system substrate-binding protein